MYRLKIDPQVTERYPGYTALIIYARDLLNKQSAEASLRVLREAETVQRQAFGDEKPTDHYHIAAWREAYKNFGVKPSKYPCSVEALLGRTLKGFDLPDINWIVNLYNAISLRQVLPVGGEDWDKLTSDLTLTLAVGQEPFTVYQEGHEVTTYPQPGEVIWAGSSGVTCRMWNWRQCYRTRVREDTYNVYFVLDRLAPYPLTELEAAGQELGQLLQAFSPGCHLEYELLGQQK